MPIFCSIKEQTGKTNFNEIISQQYKKFRGMASYFILSTLRLVIFGITNMKLANYSIILATENILI